MSQQVVTTSQLFIMLLDSKEHCDAATSYNKLGSVYEALGHYNEAKECQEKAPVMRKNIFGRSMVISH